MKIADRFQELRADGRTALIPFIMAGDPDINFTVKLAMKLAGAGADTIELGIPFSDPLADGPTIQAAASRALAKGIRIAHIFEAVTRIRESTAIPLVFLVYYNSIYRFGIDRFLEECNHRGVDGLIIPDLPPEDGAEFWQQAQDYGVDSILLAAPTSTSERLQMIASVATGFIYCVSVTGVTGARGQLPAYLNTFIGRIRDITSKPLALGFGISNAQQAAAAAALTDGVIIGSALIDRIMKNDGCMDKGLELIATIRHALDRSGEQTEHKF